MSGLVRVPFDGGRVSSISGIQNTRIPHQPPSQAALHLQGLWPKLQLHRPARLGRQHGAHALAQLAAQQRILAGHLSEIWFLEANGA